MEVYLKPGTYIVAVSGGVDSMVLLDLLSKATRLKLVVAHYEHGIREDSHADFMLVKAVAKKYNLPFVAAHGALGPGASEAEARDARYNFLFQAMHEEGAAAVVTAHHQDDVLETAILNLLRGTGRLGLSSLRTRDHLIRPLLDYSKKDIRAYADANGLKWHEDSTNTDDRYLRNYIRQHILSRFGEDNKQTLLNKVKHAKEVNDEIDSLLAADLDNQASPTQLNRSWYLQLPYTVAKEIMAAWLRRNGVIAFDRKLLEHLVVSAKTAGVGKMTDVNARVVLEFTKDKVKLLTRD